MVGADINAHVLLATAVLLAGLGGAGAEAASLTRLLCVARAGAGVARPGAVRHHTHGQGSSRHARSQPRPVLLLADIYAQVVAASAQVVVWLVLVMVSLGMVGAVLPAQHVKARLDLTRQHAQDPTLPIRSRLVWSWLASTLLLAGSLAQRLGSGYTLTVRSRLVWSSSLTSYSPASPLRIPRSHPAVLLACSGVGRAARFVSRLVW
jgi:hypothetical protein